MLPSLRRIAVMALIVCVLLAGAALVLLGHGDRSADQARWREAAAAAAPIVALVESYRRERGALPRDAGDLAGRVPDGLVAEDIGALIRFDTGTPPAWLYSLDADGTGFELSRKLGTDTKLVYSEEAGRGRWTYDPGDGNDPVPVEIHP